jgi:hypothetical protein
VGQFGQLVEFFGNFRWIWVEFGAIWTMGGGIDDTQWMSSDSDEYRLGVRMQDVAE